MPTLMHVNGCTVWNLCCLLHADIEDRSLAKSRSKGLLQDVYKTFTRPEPKYHLFNLDLVKICTDKNGRIFGLCVSDKIFKIKLVELFENDGSIQNDHTESKRYFTVKQLIVRGSIFSNYHSL
jgi:hypothetical protein